MMRMLSCLLLVLCAMPALAQECPPAGQTRESLQALKLLKFTLPDAGARNALAEGLLGCLADPDPTLRDGIAYEALAQWMRAGDFDADELRKLRDALYAMLDGDDADGFRRPFAALVLSEVARTDRIQPWMTPAERDGDGRQGSGVPAVGRRLSRLRRRPGLAPRRRPRRRLADAVEPESGAGARAARRASSPRSRRRRCRKARMPTCSANRAGWRGRCCTSRNAACIPTPTGRRGSPRCRRNSAMPRRPMPTAHGWRAVTT